MAAADGVIQLPPDSTGKKVDTAEFTRDDAAVVERQRVAIGDATDQRMGQAVRGEQGYGQSAVGDTEVRQLLARLLETAERIELFLRAQLED